jgi:hypothetical protein
MLALKAEEQAPEYRALTKACAGEERAYTSAAARKAIVRTLKSKHGGGADWRTSWSRRWYGREGAGQSPCLIGSVARTSFTASLKRRTPSSICAIDKLA